MSETINKKLNMIRRLSTKSKANGQKELLLHHYTYKNDIAGVKKCLSQPSCDLGATDMRGRTALYVATCFSRLEIARMLLAVGCDPNVKDKDGNSPLHEATYKSCLQMVQLLVNSGKCQLNVQNNEGQTPLMKAAFYDYNDILKYLHKKGADMNILDHEGKTALFYALSEGNENAAKCLMAAGCDVNGVNNDGHSALYVAVHSQYLKSTDCLVLLEKAGYSFKKDAVWLAREDMNSKFFQKDELYVRILKSAGVSAKPKDSPMLTRAKRDPWLIPYTLVLGKDNQLSSPRPPRACSRKGRESS